MSKAYCINCRLLMQHCICGFRPKCATKLHWLLLTHSTESNKRSNSGFHVKKLLGPRVQSVYWQRNADQQFHSMCQDPPVLLFPRAYVESFFLQRKPFMGKSDALLQHSDMTSWSEPNVPEIVSELPEHWRSRQFIIIDATWQQARKMYRQSQWLQSLDVWSLPESSNSVLSDFKFTLRKNQVSSGCSTIEVVARVMEEIGETEDAMRMLTFFDRFQRDTNDPTL